MSRTAISVRVAAALALAAGALGFALGGGAPSRALADDKPAAPPPAPPVATVATDVGTWPTEVGGKIPRKFGRIVGITTVPGGASTVTLTYFQNDDGVIRVVAGGAADPWHKVFVIERTD